MSVIPLRNNNYGFPTPLSAYPPFPIISQRVPTTHDFAQIGTEWVYVPGNAVYILTSIVSNLANWQLLLTSGAAGSFTTLVSTGQFNLDTVAVGVNTLGNLNGATSISELVGTGGWSADGVGASNFAIGASTVGGTITVGGAGMTGALTFGNSTAGQTVSIASAINAGAQIVNIANGASAANSTVNILSGNGSAGVQTLNLVTGTRAGVVNIATGAAANATTIGTSTAGASMTIRSGSNMIMTLTAAAGVESSASIYVGGDTGAGIVGTTGLTNANVPVAGGTGVMVVQTTSGAGTTASAGFLKLYLGATTIFVPYWLQTT